MKIAILHTDFRIYWPPRLKALNAFLMTMGHSLTVIEIAGEGSPYSFAEHEDITDFPSWLILFPARKIEDISAREARRAIVQTLDRIDPDVLLSGALAYYSGATAVRWAGRRNKPLVIFDNARLQDVQRNFFINGIKNQLYGLADAIFCPAPSHAESFKFWGFKKDAIFYGLNCVDNSFFKDHGHAVNTREPQRKLPQRYFLSVGRQVAKKNLILLVRAYKEYLKQTKGPPIALVIVGDGPQNAILRLLAGELIDEFVFFLPFYTQKQLIPVYHGSTAYVLPSLHGETWGLTVNEAMACGKPVIVSDQCGCSETLVHEGENGWKFNPASQDELTGVFMEIGSTDTKHIAEMGKASEKIISSLGLENFTGGIWGSVNHAISRNQKANKSKSLLRRILSLLWLGRYRPEKPVKNKRINGIKHLVILHTDLRLYWESRALNLLGTLQKTGIRLDVVEIAGKGSPYAFETEKKKNGDLKWHILFPDKAAEDIPSAESQRAIRKKLRELNPDVVMAGAIAYQSGTAALKWKALTGKPVMIFDDARPEDVQRSRLINAVKRIFYKEADAVICPAPSHTKGFVQWGLKKEEIFFGIDVVNNDYFGKRDKGSGEISESIKVSQPYLLAIGRQVEKKNWLNMVNAFVRFKDEHPESLLNLVFIGEGPQHRLLVEIAEAGKRKDVVFLSFLQQDAIVDYYHHAKGLILPSRFGETWGLVVNEAMAAGLPVLVSRECGCSATLVREGINGWTFDPHDVGEISNAIGKLDHLSKDEWLKMGQASLEIIKEWNLSRFTAGVAEALGYILTKSKIKSSWLARILICFWHGRYRPT